ncbi:MAG TPA: LysR family transcriptional regulator [Pseudonocardia sp.]|nr:LysR family transcriptional regulator [Pseudonocardia sp.]
MLDIQRLRVFRAVVATGSVGGAASSLGYTPSAISQHLTALQRETGLALVERRGRGISPTAAGVALADGLGPFFAGLAEVESMVGDLRAGRVGTLTISYFASAGATWIPPVVAVLVREFPQLRLDLRLFELAGDSPVDADVEIFVDGASRGTGGQVIELLYEPYVVVLPEGHRLADRAQIPLAELRDEQWVDNDFSRGPCRQVVLDACAAAGFTPAFPIETHDYPTAVAFVAAGVGITVLPRLGTTMLPPGVRAVPVVDPVPRRRILLRVKDALSGHPAVTRAVELLRGVTAQR